MNWTLSACRAVIFVSEHWGLGNSEWSSLGYEIDDSDVLVKHVCSPKPSTCQILGEQRIHVQSMSPCLLVSRRATPRACNPTAVTPETDCKSLATYREHACSVRRMNPTWRNTSACSRAEMISTLTPLACESDSGKQPEIRVSIRISGGSLVSPI